MSYPRDDSPDAGGKPLPGTDVFTHTGRFLVLADGRFLRAAAPIGEGRTEEPVKVWRSVDEGRQWDLLTEFVMEIHGGFRERHNTNAFVCLPDDTVIWPVLVGTDEYEGEGWRSACIRGSIELLMYRSRDQGRTWQACTDGLECPRMLQPRPCGRPLSALSSGQ